MGWADTQWSLPCQRALTSLWGMYENERAEKMKVEEEYSVLQNDVNLWVDTTVSRSLKKNYAKIMSGEEDAKVELDTLKEEKKIWEDEKKKMK